MHAIIPENFDEVLTEFSLAAEHPRVMNGGHVSRTLHLPSQGAVLHGRSANIQAIEKAALHLDECAVAATGLQRAGVAVIKYLPRRLTVTGGLQNTTILADTVWRASEFIPGLTMQESLTLNAGVLDEALSVLSEIRGYAMSAERFVSGQTDAAHDTPREILDLLRDEDRRESYFHLSPLNESLLHQARLLVVTDAINEFWETDSPQLWCHGDPRLANFIGNCSIGFTLIDFEDCCTSIEGWDLGDFVRSVLLTQIGSEPKSQLARILTYCSQQASTNRDLLRQYTLLAIAKIAFHIVVDSVRRHYFIPSFMKPQHLSNVFYRLARCDEVLREW